MIIISPFQPIDSTAQVEVMILKYEDSVFRVSDQEISVTGYIARIHGNVEFAYSRRVFIPIVLIPLNRDFDKKITG